MRISLIAGLILFLAAVPARAEQPVWPTEPLRNTAGLSKGTWTLIDENDLFGGTDQNYTNGLQISWLSAKNALPPAIDAVSDRLSFLAKPGADWRYGYIAGQAMYTPNDISATQPLPGQRPYAGWLYGGFSLTADSGDRLDTVEIHAGVIGPSSAAEFVQRNWHAQIGSPDPKGWDNQLHDEPGLMVVYERKWRNLAEFGVAGFGVDVTPHAGFALGNIHTHAAAGATLRIGRDLADDFGPPRIRPALAGAGYFEPSHAFSWYLFAGVEGRAVARNIFLDGNTFRDSLSVDKEPFVGDVQAGLVIQTLGVQVAFTGVYRTEEFKGQDKPDLFGAVSLGWKW